jgi:16S rRNA (guanine966-N2)-methyltransferase
VRIVAGQFKGRRLKRPSDRRVRVTTERVREAWLSILAPSLPGARVLDLFAGSGVLGLEALSRGAVQADFVDLSADCVRTIRSNVAVLGVSAVTRIYRGDALRFVGRLGGGSYDIVLADPPYSTDQALRLLTQFHARPFTNVLSVEHSAALKCHGDETRRYGDVAVTFCYEH